jgi:transcriptional regulator GlxA family with amidase domain
MNRAAETLRRTSLSIAEVARQCGFPDASHFGKTFLRRMGATPLAYRRQSKGV